MANRKVSSLSDGHMQARGKLAGAVTPMPSSKRVAEKSLLNKLFPDERAELLKDIPIKIIKDAWFISAHILLDDGAHIVDMGCGKGEMAYALSLIKPKWNITAIDSDKNGIKFASANYKNKNLTFMESDLSTPLFPDKSIDAIINSYVLHEVYSEAHFNTRKVSKTLECHYNALKTNGFMYVRAYTTPGPAEYILMELKKECSRGDKLEDLSEADLLIWFSDNVRSGDSLTTGGFYLEELPARFPNTRLFRLPHKWAYEFILRKDDKELLAEDLDTEYTFATQRDLRRELRSLGARLVYCASHWDNDFVQKNMIDHFKLYQENGEPLGYPETSYTMLLQKIEQKESIRYQEWRATRKKPETISIQSVRNNETGVILDIATRHLDLTEVIPFYENSEGELKVFLQESTPRSITNTVPRQGHNIDGKNWSGHMIESLPFNTQDLDALDNKAEKKKRLNISEFIKDQLDLKTASESLFIDGQCSYPAPKSIDERIDTKYIRVRPTKNSKSLYQTDYVPPEGSRFNTFGDIREFDAQAVLNAISVGLIPSARLEIQILKLFKLLKKNFTKWSETPLVLSELHIKERLDIQDTLADMAEEKKRFAPVKTSAGSLKVIHSVFMEEGHDDLGGMTDLSSHEQDFFVPEEDSQSIAVVIPLARDINGEVMMGIIKDHAPVPERFQGNGTMLNVPSFPIPTHIEDLDAAKRYVAEMFEVDPKFVGTMGEPYFQYIGMTPQKVYPFAVTNMSEKYDYEHFSLTTYAPLNSIYIITAMPVNRNSPTDLIYIVSEAYHMLSDNEQSLDHGFSKDLYVEHTAQTSYESDFVARSNHSRASTNKKPQVS